MKLAAAEETLMQHLWNRERAFMKDLLDAYDDPKPAATTVATLLKRMADKGVVSYREWGNSREYYPLISRQAYFADHVNGLIKNFFNNSAAQFASFFTTETGLSADELETLKKIVDEQLKKEKAMIAYVLKSGLSLLILFGFYKIWLQNQRMHRFNRFYLLGSLLFSGLVPLLALDIWPATVWTVSTGPEPVGERALVYPLHLPDTGLSSGDVPPPYWLWLYGFVTLVLLARFARNVYTLIRRIADHPKQPFRGATLVRLNEAGLPHTFLHYLFVSARVYDRGAIEDELFTHELTHIRQRHSLDVLFVEGLICFGWFNPLLIGFKRAIQLNHEFLADDAVNRKHQNVTHYQRLLLSKLTPATPVSLTSTLTFQTTKQRLIMMTKHTSRAGAWLAGASATFLFGALTLLLGTTTSAQITPATSSTNGSTNPPQPETDVAKMERLYGDKLVALPGPKFGRKKFSDLTPDEKRYVKFIPPFPRLVPADGQLTDWKNAKKYGVWINEKRVPNDRLNRYTAQDFDSYFVSKLEKNAINYGKHYFQVDLMTRSAYAAYLKESAQSPFLVLMPNRKPVD